MEHRSLTLFYELCRLCLKNPAIHCIFFDGKDLLSQDIFTFTGVEVSSSDNLPQKICTICYSVIEKMKDLRTQALLSENNLRLLFGDDFRKNCDMVQETSDEPEKDNSNKHIETQHIDNNSVIEPVRQKNTISVRKDLFATPTLLPESNRNNKTRYELEKNDSNKQKNVTVIIKKKNIIKLKKGETQNSWYVASTPQSKLIENSQSEISKKARHCEKAQKIHNKVSIGVQTDIPSIDKDTVIEKSRPSIDKDTVIEQSRPSIDNNSVIEQSRPSIDKDTVTEQSRPSIDKNVLIEQNNNKAATTRPHSPDSTASPVKEKKIKLQIGDSFICEVCSKVFTENKKFYLHQRQHNKKICCPIDICGKRFATKADLEKHIRTHTGEKPYKCNICHSRFAQMVTLKQHRNNVHSQKIGTNLKTKAT